MLEVLQDSSLVQIKQICHGVFTRKGGVSQGIYSSLNCAYPSDDRLENVRENRRRVMAHFGLPFEALVSPKMVHANQVITVEKPWSDEQRPDADALVTRLPGIVLGMDSADCPIVLLADESQGVIGLAHAGWKGAQSGVLEATVKAMMALGSQTQHISAAISPCIAQPSYEVSLSFYQQFVEMDADNQSYFTVAKKTDHFFFDLLGYVRDRLLKLNLKSVSTEIALDTYADEEKFFSCRRTLHKGEPWFGGHFNCITLAR